MSTLPKPVRSEGRICFGIAWFHTEAEAAAYDEYVRTCKRTYEGGYMDGRPCGRDTTYDYVDDDHGKLYAVTR